MDDLTPDARIVAEVLQVVGTAQVVTIGSY